MLYHQHLNIMINSGLDVSTYDWFHPLPAPVARIIVEYAREKPGYYSLRSYFEQTTDMGCSGAVFDGERFRVLDWKTIWTRSSSVDVDKLTATYSFYNHRQKIWTRTLQRVSKYRDRGFDLGIHVPRHDYVDHLQTQRRRSFTSSQFHNGYHADYRNHKFAHHYPYQWG